jgi:RNA polymerase sigma factor (sigma-70 family)
METTDAALLEATAAGDAEAFACFWERRVGTVTAYAIRRCSNPDEVADVVAECFLTAYRIAGRYRPLSATAVPWLLGIVERTAAAQRRAWLRWVRIGRRATADRPRFHDDEYDAVDAAIDAARQAPEIEAALAALPARERAVLELTAYAQLSPSEAAAALDISPNAARLRLARARKRMRERLLRPGQGIDDLGSDLAGGRFLLAGAGGDVE